MRTDRQTDRQTNGHYEATFFFLNFTNALNKPSRNTDVKQAHPESKIISIMDSKSYIDVQERTPVGGCQAAVSRKEIVKKKKQLILLT